AFPEDLIFRERPACRRPPRQRLVTMIPFPHIPSVIRRGRLLRSTALVALVMLIAIAVLPSATLAHPLDEYPQLSYVTVTPTTIEVEVDATPGVLLAADTLAEIDTNGDQTISDTEAQAYVNTIVNQLSLAVDGTSLPLTLASYEMPAYLNIQAGYGEIKVFVTATLPESIAASTATHEITYTNGFAPPKSRYQVNTFTSGATPIALGTQQRSDDQQSLTVGFSIGGTVSSSESSSEATTSTATSATGWLGDLLAYLQQPDFSPSALTVAIGLAIVLGGIHALTPGHGKTLVAAYLVGNKGTVRHAAALGATVTLTHTLSVIGIGLIALFASQLLVPGILVPALQVLSGLLVVVLGVRLVGQRWRAARLGRTGIATAAHTHAGAMGAQVHDHGDGRMHSHTVPDGPLTGRGLVAMGVSGGLVPCPEALGIMILAVGLNHIALGLGLIVAFSIGLATVLIGLGILLVRSRRLLDRIGKRGTAFQQWLPLTSATVVLLLGIGITAKGLASVNGLGGAMTEPAMLAVLGMIVLVAAAGLAFRFRERSHTAAAGSTALVPLSMLPPRYQDGHAVSSAPMGAAPLVFDETGAVAWNRIWGHDDPDQPFCDLALAGGPPHRGTMLEPDPESVANARVKDLDAVRTEIERGLRMVTGLPVTRTVEPGWIGLTCPDTEAAAWLAQAIDAENVRARQDGAIVLLPADPSFRTETEIKNVVTAAAKTWHYWSEHAAAQATPTSRPAWPLPALRWAWK
ncbi:MAG: hypothetical protein QM589_12675, partial [Thermomicrobiales bacterium]